jgi:predicted nucleotidyltransferase component of viral defense system
MNTGKSQKAINLLNEIQDYPIFKDYTLIGGTALAIYLDHRESEDLDFVTQNEKLGKINIKFFINSLEKKSFNIKKIYDEAGYINKLFGIYIKLLKNLSKLIILTSFCILSIPFSCTTM